MKYLEEYNSNRQRVFLHILFWIFIIAFEVSRYHMSFKGYSFDLFIKNLIEETTYVIFVIIPASYFTTYVLFNKFYFKKRYTEFIIYLVSSIILFAYLLRILIHVFILPNLYPEYFKENSDFFAYNIIKHVFYIYSAVVMFVVVKLIRQFYQVNKAKEQLKKQSVESELNLLRSQVNPHFLFNTLNNINSLVYKNPDLTYLSIIKLSDIMRYMLYESNIKEVTLENEIEYLKSYIGLQQLRLENPDFVKFNIEGNYAGKMIAPMLFIAFVENSFKYADKNAKSPGIEIHLILEKNEINFEVKNYKKKIESPDLSNNNGIGISNVKRRLELIYQDKHELTIFNTDEKYHTKLKIEL
jgi:two-component system, LytTR family, sensor kinase